MPPVNSMGHGCSFKLIAYTGMTFVKAVEESLCEAKVFKRIMTGMPVYMVTLQQEEGIQLWQIPPAEG